MRLGRAEVHNVVELLDLDDGPGRAPCRIPEALRVTLNAGARRSATRGAGSEIRFNLEGERARVTLRCPEGPALAEVRHGPFTAQGKVVGAESTVVEITRPPVPAELLARIARERELRFDPGLVRIVLPHIATRIVGEVEGDISPPRPEQAPKTRWLAYGSSVTQGARALRPSGTYAMRTAEFLGVELLNLGFGGGAHLEPQLADYIAARDDWDFASLEMGINMLGGFTVEEFSERVDYFVSKIVEAHPDKWIFCIDIFACRGDFTGEEKPRAFREVVRRKVDSIGSISSIGSAKVVHVPGTEVLRAPSGLMADLVHPAPAGMEEMAGNLARIIRKKMRA